MPKKAPASQPPPSVRRRRTSEEARAAILDAAERRLVASGPAGIRLQEVAKDVGVSHPTVLHHFKSREGLIEAVVGRSLDSLRADLITAVQQQGERAADSEPSRDELRGMLDAVSGALTRSGNARAFLWLELSGYASSLDEMHVRAVAEATHAVRVERCKAKKKRGPDFADSYFTVMLPALALISLALFEPSRKAKASDPLGPEAFRAWLAELLASHLERRDV